ncbi:putative Charged multivesicular body protein [Zostera marina]|uniref:Putative Charged multivesicular body protein n=1 Tax=Zostera marina TaxID=29655 RepID=A0A0K9NIG7_ZOSMR|nr:putative Charged multivesicular body protein [Zostera marina]
MMNNIFRFKKKNKEPPTTIQDASDRLSKRGESVEEKIKKLDVELARYGEQIRKTRPGHSQDSLKNRAMRILKQKRMYEKQCNIFYNQTYNLEQVSFATDGLKDAQQTMSSLKSANKELKGIMKTVNISDIDGMQDQLMDFVEESTEIQESLGRTYNVPDYIDEDELLSEIGGLEEDMKKEIQSNNVPSYLLPVNDLDIEDELHLPTVPTGRQAIQVDADDEIGLRG